MQIINYSYEDKNKLLDYIVDLCSKGNFVAILFNNIKKLKDFSKILKTKFKYKRGVFLRTRQFSKTGIVVLFIDEKTIYEEMFDYKIIIN